MRRPAKSRSRQRAFLLVEATLTAVVIAVGLVFISRGVSTSLKALARIQQYERLLRLAESVLSELETQAQQGQPISHHEEGTFEKPNADYRWHVAVNAFQLPTGDIPPDAFRPVTLTIRQIGASTPVVRLHTIWPSEWLTTE